jgi:hypothetical protein
MKLDMVEYRKMLADNHISVIYSGPMWMGGIKGIGEWLQRRLDFGDIPISSSRAIFSVFIEQMTNMMNYSAESETYASPDGDSIEASMGTFIFGIQDKQFFIQCGNVVSNKSAEILKERIDYLNTLDKKQIRQYFKEQSRADDTNPESKGAGLGLIVIAQRATSAIEYAFTPYGEDTSFFTMYVTV